MVAFDDRISMRPTLIVLTSFQSVTHDLKPSAAPSTETCSATRNRGVGSLWNRQSQSTARVSKPARSTSATTPNLTYQVSR